VNCTSAKTKCSPLASDPDSCSRCHRLGKSCVYLTAPVRPYSKRTSLVSPFSNSVTAFWFRCVVLPAVLLIVHRRRQQLEAKVDSLFNLLANNGSAAGSILSDAPTTNGPNVTSSVCNPNGSGVQPRVAPTPSPPHSVRPNRAPDPVGTSYECINLIAIGLIPAPKAEQLVAFYTRELMLQFPFITFLPTETISTIQRDRPLLLQSILAVTSNEDASMQKKIGNEVVKTIHMRMSSRSNYSLDLLQAVMVCAAWYQFFFDPATQQFSTMIYYCIILVNELGLDRGLNRKTESLMLYNGQADSRQARLSEAYRALLGTYYLSTSSVLVHAGLKSFNLPLT
jgi:hypothetical protein